MADLGDLSHWYGSDLDVTGSGDIAVAATWKRTTQRVIRRLMTAPVDAVSADYCWQPAYGVGLGERIGSVLDVRALTAAVQSQVLLEPSVARDPAPIIKVTSLGGDNGAAISITYSDLSGDSQTFAFNLAPF